MRCLQGESSSVAVVWASLLAGEAALPGPAQLPEPHPTQGKASPFPVHCSDNPCSSQSCWTSWKFAFEVGMAHIPQVRNDLSTRAGKAPSVPFHCSGSPLPSFSQHKSRGALLLLSSISRALHRPRNVAEIQEGPQNTDNVALINFFVLISIFPRNVSSSLVGKVSLFPQNTQAALSPVLPSSSCCDSTDTHFYRTTHPY